MCERRSQCSLWGQRQGPTLLPPIPTECLQTGHANNFYPPGLLSDAVRTPRSEVLTPACHQGDLKGRFNADAKSTSRVSGLPGLGGA